MNTPVKVLESREAPTRCHFTRLRIPGFIVAEAGREFFSKDDSAQLVEVLTKASPTAEWAEVAECYAD